MNLPDRITVRQYRAALKALGIPVEVTVARAVLEHDTVTLDVQLGAHATATVSIDVDGDTR